MPCSIDSDETTVERIIRVKTAPISGSRRSDNDIATNHENHSSEGLIVHDLENNRSTTAPGSKWVINEFVEVFGNCEGDLG